MVSLGLNVLINFLLISQHCFLTTVPSANMPFHSSTIFTLAYLLALSLAHLPQQKKHHFNWLSYITKSMVDAHPSFLLCEAILYLFIHHSTWHCTTSLKGGHIVYSTVQIASRIVGKVGLRNGRSTDNSGLRWRKMMWCNIFVIILIIMTLQTKFHVEVIFAMCFFSRICMLCKKILRENLYETAVPLCFHGNAIVEFRQI